MNSLENQFKIELFKRFLPRMCKFINQNNTYAFNMKFDNDILTINNVTILIEYHVGKLEAHLETETEVILANFELPMKHKEEFPYLEGLDLFLSQIISKLNKKKMLDNIGDMPVNHLRYDYSVKDFVQIDKG
jgi:hypothetical protein